MPPAHPLVDALREAEDLEEIAKKHGAILAMWVGEDEIIRGRSSARAPAPGLSEEASCVD